jgi:hypothetical protein
MLVKALLSSSWNAPPRSDPPSISHRSGIRPAKTGETITITIESTAKQIQESKGTCTVIYMVGVGRLEGVAKQPPVLDLARVGASHIYSFPNEDG